MEIQSKPAVELDGHRSKTVVINAPSNEVPPHADVGAPLTASAPPDALGTASSQATLVVSGAHEASRPRGPAPLGAYGKAKSLTPIMAPWELTLPGVTSAEIRAELAKRARRAPKLMAERDQLIQRMDAIEDVLTSIGENLPEAETVAAPRAQRSPRPRNTASLRDAIAAAVQPAAMVTPAEVAEMVRSAGYSSTAANFGQMVASALARDGRFERIARGRYRRRPA